MDLSLSWGSIKTKSDKEHDVLAPSMHPDRSLILFALLLISTPE